MQSLALLLGAVTLFGAVTANFGFLQEYHGNFSALSRVVEFELQQKREFNGALIHEFNREMLLELAIMIPRMRQVSQETELFIRNYENIDEYCRETTLGLFAMYRDFQEWDIQSCAYYAYDDIQYDTLNRFLPYERTFAHENIRSLSQTIQTLGRHNMVDMETIERDLEEELDYYETLHGTFMELLDEELSKHGQAAYVTINRFEGCRDVAYMYQDGDMEYIRSYIAENCYFR